MSKKLEAYLEQVKDLLVTNEDPEDVLSEIESHILEKCKKEYGEINEENVEKILKSFGKPIEIAKSYSIGEPLIPVFFKKILFFYTGVLFVIHLGLNGLSMALGRGGFLFPFFFEGRPDWGAYISSIPLLAIFDFGLVCLFLSAISTMKNPIFLPLPRKSFLRPKGEQKYKIWVQILYLIATGFLISVAMDPINFEEFVRNVFSATDINFVGFYGLFTGFYFGIAISTAAETVIYLVSKWFRTGFGEFLKALVSFTVCQYVLSTAVEGLTGVNHTVQIVLQVLMIIGLVGIAIQMISIIVRGVVKEVKANL